jgi:hypothetical protein
MHYNIYGVSRYRVPFLVATVDYTLMIPYASILRRPSLCGHRVMDTRLSRAECRGQEKMNHKAARTHAGRRASEKLDARAKVSIPHDAGPHHAIALFGHIPPDEER